MKRREFLQRALAGGSLALGAGMTVTDVAHSQSSSSGYKAVVVVFLNGGNDGNDVLVPTDGAYNDYQNARPNLALPKSGLSAFTGSHLGHAMGLNSALSPLMTLFDRKRLAFLVNAGALVAPTSVDDVLAGRARLPPFLYSHPEQTQYVMGWMGDEDQSGWGGRGIEAMPDYATLKSALLAVDGQGATLVTGQKARLVTANSRFSARMGEARLTSPTDDWTRVVESITRLQSDNAVQAEYARTFRSLFLDATEMARADEVTPQPAGQFSAGELGQRLSFVARAMNYFRSAGASRQIYSVQWGSFDTHTNQRESTASTNGPASQDSQLAELASNLVALDDSIRAAGMDNEVVVLVASEFGRTLDPAAGNGSDHAWGNHWWVMGGPVSGGQLLGSTFPSLMLKGKDDADPGGRGYWVPQISSDQVAAELLTWLGLPSSRLVQVLPNLTNFSQQRVGFIHG